MEENRKLGLRVYSFTLRRSRNRGADAVFPLNSAFEAYADNDSYSIPSALGLFEEFISSSGVAADKEESQQLFRCDYNPTMSGETDDFAYLIFSVYSGRYGYKAKIVNRVTKETTYEKNKDEAEEKQFYVAIIIPKDNASSIAKRGLLLFQEIGVYGIKTITSDYMRLYFSRHYKLSLSITNLAPAFFLQHIFENGKIQKIRLSQYATSYDAADRLYGAGFQREERTLTPFRVTRELKEKLKYVSESKYNFYHFEGIDYSDVRMVVDIGGRTRTINLHGIEDLSIEESLPDELLLADGTVNYDAFRDYIMELSVEYLKHLPTNE